MNPFALEGPEFLLFYAGLIAAVFVAMVALRRALGAGGLPDRPVLDPLTLAHLRAGPASAVRAATLGMVQREILDASGSSVSARGGDSVAGARSPLERAIADACRGTARAISGLAADPVVAAIGRQRHDELVAAGLLMSRRARRGQALIWLGGAALLIGVAWHKAAIGLALGRPIEGLIAIASIAVIASPFVVFRRRTGRGDRVLDAARTLLRPVRETHAAPSADGRTEMLLFAAFGFAAIASVPSLAFAAEGLAHRHGSSSGSNWYGGGGGTGCGAGSGCGGGGGGGDGGGGGGCGGGGCGGCGS